MLSNLRRKIGVALTRLSFRKKRNSPISFSSVFTSARTALVIVPENTLHRSIALPLLTMFQEKFQGNRLTLIVTDTTRDLTNAFMRSVVVPVQKDQTNFFFLPKKTPFKRLLNQKYDIAVDLNLSLVPTSAYFIRGANAPYKIGFTQDHSDSFYNFQVNSAPNRSAKNRYEQLFRTLSMF